MSQLAFILRTLLSGWLRAIPTLIALLPRRLATRRRGRRQSERDRQAARTSCVPIDRPEFVRPDPLIYSQRCLMQLGLAVTWNNPDIQLHRNGLPVSSSSLEPGVTYDIVARIWNESPSAPVVQMPVHFLFLDFGIGTVNVPIGSTTVDLGVKGGPNHPAFATIPWTTPTRPGHYGLQVLLDPADDRNELNNLGQENTNVGMAQSPVDSTFTLRNDTRQPQRYRFEVDAYTLGEPDPCEQLTHGEAARKERVERHRRGAHPLPAGWLVAINPATPSLLPDATVDVTVTVTPPDTFHGTQSLNVNAFHDNEPVGGVTLTVVAAS
jgi:hypothetical protein